MAGRAAGLFLACVAAAWAGGSGLNVAVVVNQQSTNSIQLGNYFCEHRNVPPQNVLRINWTGGNVSWTLTQLQSLIATPLAAMLSSRGLGQQIDYVVLAMDIPYRVTDSGEANSTTAVLFYGFKKNDVGSSGPCRLPSTSFNGYAGSETPFRLSAVGASPGAFLTSLLTGASLDEAKRIVDQGVASDGTFPSQPVILAKTTDTARNVRYFSFDHAIFESLLGGRPAMYRTNSNQTAGFANLLGLQTGLRVLDVSAGTFVPGTMADSLTSYAGMLFETSGQTNLLAFTRAGAAGSYGTVVEPCNYLEKFPDPLTYFYQGRGFSLAECYYQSLVSPYMGLVVAEPLAAPFAQPGLGAWVSPPPSAVLSGTANLSGTFDAASASRPLQQVDLFIDGTFASTGVNVPPAAGNVLTVTLDGHTVNYTVPPDASLASVTSGLTDQINLDSGLTQVQAVSHGDRIELQSTDLPARGADVSVAASQAVGSASALTTFVRASRPDFLDSQALGWRSFEVSGTPATGDFLRLTIVKTNGASVVVTATAGSSPTTVVQLTTQLLALVNARPELQSADGVLGGDTYPDGTAYIQFLLYARASGINAAQIQVTLQSSPSLVVSPAMPVRLDENVSDLRPRNHLYLTAGLAQLAYDVPLDTTLRPDGYHELTLVAYEGSQVRTQTRVSRTVRFQNTTLSATFTSLFTGNQAAVEGSVPFAVTANRSSIATIDLHGTGGLLASVPGQATANFSIAGATLGLGLHPFYALVTATDGAVYRTETKWVRLVPQSSLQPTAAWLLSFEAHWTEPGRVLLQWRTGVEATIIGFRLERRAADGGWVRLHTGLIPALGGSRPNPYWFEDANAPALEPLAYRILEVDLAGKETVLAQAQPQAGPKVFVEWTAAGLTVLVQGAPSTPATVEASVDPVRGPWTLVADFRLDALGRGALQMEGPPPGSARFYRIRQNERSADQ